MHVPTFCTMSVLERVLLTGATPKSTSSGSASTARGPSARTGTANFSRSVQHTRSTRYSFTSCGRNLTTKHTSMPAATLPCLSSWPDAVRGPTTSKNGDCGGSTLIRRATLSLLRKKSVCSYTPKAA
jgi:hypothetical protein